MKLSVSRNQAKKLSLTNYNVDNYISAMKAVQCPYTAAAVPSRQCAFLGFLANLITLPYTLQIHNLVIRKSWILQSAIIPIEAKRDAMAY